MIYEGARTPHGCVVTADGRPLPPRHDLRNHAPTGFEWGYPGSGPAQLALAILAHHCMSDEQRALNLYHGFKETVIARIHASAWCMTSAFIEHELCLLEAQDARSEPWRETA